MQYSAYMRQGPAREGDFSPEEKEGSTPAACAGQLADVLRRCVPGADIAAILLIYGFPITLLGFALSYAQLKPVPCRTTAEALRLRDAQATDIQKQARAAAAHAIVMHPLYPCAQLVDVQRPPTSRSRRAPSLRMPSGTRGAPVAECAAVSSPECCCWCCCCGPWKRTISCASALQRARLLHLILQTIWVSREAGAWPHHVLRVRAAHVGGCAQLREDVTRYRYGDEQHLDEALTRIFQFGRQQGIPRRYGALPHLNVSSP